MLRLTTLPPATPRDMDVLRFRRSPHAPLDRRCPNCGEILDAPRRNPATGARGRKCSGCTAWQPIRPS